MAALDPTHHAMDSTYLDFFGYYLHLPKIAGFQITKYMVLIVVAAGIVTALAFWMQHKARQTMAPKGRFYHFWEAILVFVRDDIARPNIGEHDGDRFLPFLWTMFLFILCLNLLGMIPLAGSATASISVTAGLAICSFVTIHLSGILKMGPGHYIKAMVPPVPWPLWPLMFVVELVGHAAKPFALAVRLFANMFAGHTVLAALLGFIFLVGNNWANLGIAPVSVIGVVAMSLLELFVAFLQTYIFVFLSSIFIGMAVHPEH